MNGNIDSAEKRRNHSLCGFELRRSARYIEFSCQSCRRSGGSEIQGVLLRLDILVCDLQPVLEAAQLRIDATNISQQNHRHVAAILLGGYHARGGRLDPTTSSPKNIELPRGAQISLE